MCSDHTQQEKLHAEVKQQKLSWPYWEEFSTSVELLSMLLTLSLLEELVAVGKDANAWRDKNNGKNHRMEKVMYFEVCAEHT